MGTHIVLPVTRQRWRSRPLLCAVLWCMYVWCCRLSELSKRMFNELGSALVQNVKFRDTWAFISQKGIQGFADIEQVCCRVCWVNQPETTPVPLVVHTAMNSRHTSPGLHVAWLGLGLSVKATSISMMMMILMVSWCNFAQLLCCTHCDGFIDCYLVLHLCSLCSSVCACQTAAC